MKRSIEPSQTAGLVQSGEIGAINLALAGLTSMHSIRAYKRHLLDFLKWYKEQGSPTLSKAIVEVYKATLLGAGKSAATINQALSAIRRLVNEAADNGKLDRETARAIGKVKGVKGESLPAGRSIPPGELHALLAGCGATVADLRDAAIIAVLYSTGMRRGELVGLDLADYDADSGELKILHGKGNRKRLVPVVNGSAAALGDWLTIRGSWAGPLFCPVWRSGHIQHTRLTTQTIYHLVKRRAISAGIDKPLSPHDFRRTVIGDLLDRGADIVTVKDLVGHANVQTTSRYDRRGSAAKRRAVETLHVPYRSKFSQEDV